MASLRILTLFITVSVALQEGCALPVSERAELPTQTQHPHRVRTKRCSCNNWEDTECIYFCHLDIIWVNTPNKLLPYGLGSPLSRRRRSADRCECLSPSDDACDGFCSKSSSDGRPDTKSTPQESASRDSSRLLTSLRSVIKINTTTAKDLLSRKPSDSKSKSRTRRKTPEGRTSVQANSRK